MAFVKKGKAVSLGLDGQRVTLDGQRVTGGPGGRESLLDGPHDFAAFTHLHAKFTVLADLPLHFRLLPHHPLPPRLLAGGVDLHDLDVVGSEGDLDVVGGRSGLGAVVADEEQVVFSSLGQWPATTRLLAVRDQHLLLELVALPQLPPPVVRSHGLLELLLLDRLGHELAALDPALPFALLAGSEELLSEGGVLLAGSDLSLLGAGVRALSGEEVAFDGLLLLVAGRLANLTHFVLEFQTLLQLPGPLLPGLAAAVDDVGVDGLDLSAAVGKEGVEVLELLRRQVAAHHLDLAQRDLRKLHPPQVLEESTEALPLQVDPLCVLGKYHRHVQPCQVLRTEIRPLHAISSQVGTLHFQEALYNQSLPHQLADVAQVLCGDLEVAPQVVVKGGGGVGGGGETQGLPEGLERVAELSADQRSKQFVHGELRFFEGVKGE